MTGMDEVESGGGFIVLKEFILWGGQLISYEDINEKQSLLKDRLMIGGG